MFGFNKSVVLPQLDTDTFDFGGFDDITLDVVQNTDVTLATASTGSAGVTSFGDAFALGAFGSVGGGGSLDGSLSAGVGGGFGFASAGITVTDGDFGFGF